MESRRSEKKNAKKIIRKVMIAKKLTALGMAAVLVFSLAACGAADSGKLSSDTVKLKAAAMGDENAYKERVLGVRSAGRIAYRNFLYNCFSRLTRSKAEWTAITKTRLTRRKTAVGLSSLRLRC